MNINELRQKLPPLRDRVYLNTGTSGPIPPEAAQAETDLLYVLVNEGFSSPPAAQAYTAALKDVRAVLADAVNAAPKNIALTHSTSEGIGIVAAGLPWQEGDEVIISDLEHISGVAPWLHLAETKGVKVVNLRTEGGLLSLGAVEEVLSSRTRLVCISHVSYATGAVLPVREVTELAHRQGALVVVDGAQGTGHLPVDVDDLGCDFYAFPGQKWFLGPEGTGALYVKDEALEAVEPTRIGWASVADEDIDALTYSLHPDARRFEIGTVHAPAFAGLAASVRLLAEIGWDTIFEHAKSLSASARSKLTALDGIKILSPADAPSGLLTFSVGEHDSNELVKSLWSEYRVVIRSIPFPKALRASFHAFNNEEDVERMVEGLGRLLKTQG